MALEITKTFVVKAPAAAVWSFLIDPERVIRCMPGAALGERIDERTFTGTMTVKVGPVTSSYKGRVVFERLDAEQHVAELVATGQDVRGKGGADLRMTSTLVEKSPGETEVTAASKVNITGILAQMGRGMIQDVSDQLFQMFTKKMRAELETEAPVAAPPVVEPVVAPVVEPVAAPAPPAAPPEALDLTAIGTRAFGRAVGRTLSRPSFWIAAFIVGALVVWLARR